MTPGINGNDLSLVARFLGPDAATGGMHALLGLPARAHGQDTVVRALERQLTRVDNHPQARTPEADEVRLALHAAAAQLVHQAAHHERSIGARAGARLSASPQRRALQLEQDALLTLARYGGWNRRALHRLTMLALARGAGPGDVASVLRHLAARRAGAAPAVPRGNFAEPRSTAIAEGDTGADLHSGKPLAVIIGAIATGLALVVGLALVLVALTTREAVPPANGVGNATEDRTPIRAQDLPMAGGEELFPWQQQAEQAPETDAEPEPAAPAFDRLSDALAALDSAPDGLEIDRAEAVRVFGAAFAAVGQRWPSLTPAQQRAAQHDVVEFAYRAVQDPGLVEPVVEAIAAASAAVNRTDAPLAEDDVWPAAWSVGVLARLARERDIGARASRAIEARLRDTVGSTVVVSGGFEQGVSTALWTMLPAMVDPAGGEAIDTAERWDRWIRAARFSGGDAQGTILSALEWTLLAPEEPDQNDATRAAIEALTLALDWGESSAARPWLVRMFADTRVSVPDLHALTTALARRSRAPGVDVTMALPVRAGAEARAGLRERYAAVWDISTDGPTLDDLAADWADAAREAAKPADDSLVARLAAAASLSRISQAANLRHLGRLDEAGVVIDEFDRPVEMELVRWNNRERGDRVDTDPGMSSWARSYLSAERDFARRIELLADASRRQMRHTTEAEVLVTEAFRGSPAKARDAARTALLTQQPSAVLTLAALELAPRIPRTPQNADLIASLTATAPVPHDDPGWALKIRRVLVQTALEQLAAEGEQGVVDSIAGVLGESYASRSMDATGSLATDTSLGFPADRAAGMLRAKWERHARRGGLGAEALEVESVLARHAARLGLAQGPVQTFAAEQFAGFELMAIAVVSERLDRASDVQALRARVRDDRRDARDIVEQIAAVERGFVELWALRLGQESPWQ